MSWIEVNDGKWNIIPVTKEEMKGKCPGILLRDYLRDEEGKETLKMLKKYKEMNREEKREFFRQKSKKLEEWLGVPLNNLHTTGKLMSIYGKK